MKYRMMVVKYGFTTVEADSESEAINIVRDMGDIEFDWTDYFDNEQVVEELEDDE